MKFQLYANISTKSLIRNSSNTDTANPETAPANGDAKAVTKAETKVLIPVKIVSYKDIINEPTQFKYRPDKLTNISAPYDKIPKTFPNMSPINSDNALVLVDTNSLNLEVKSAKLAELLSNFPESNAIL